MRERVRDVGDERALLRTDLAALKAEPAVDAVREALAQDRPFAVVFLLPMFFTFSGLNTRLDMVDSPRLLEMKTRPTNGSFDWWGSNCLPGMVAPRSHP